MCLLAGLTVHRLYSFRCCAFSLRFSYLSSIIQSMSFCLGLPLPLFPFILPSIFALCREPPLIMPYSLPFSKPVFFITVVRWKKRYLSKIYGEGSQERPETIHSHCKCLTLTFCVLCLIIVLRGILYTGSFNPGDRFIHTPNSFMGDTISRDTGYKCRWSNHIESKFFLCRDLNPRHSFIHSFIWKINIEPPQETYSEALSVQWRWKISVLSSL